jgi:hypothetical protein
MEVLILKIIFLQWITQIKKTLPFETASCILSKSKMDRFDHLLKIIAGQQLPIH